jgi:predicted enzyme related to lactoylglutathione lyase
MGRERRELVAVTKTKFALGDPCWIDITTSDSEKVRGFYAGIFGWAAGEAKEEFGGYFQFFNDGAPVAGVAPNFAGDDAPNVWSVYLNTADANAAIARCHEHGGKVAVEAMQVGDLGTMAVVVDPSGATVGIWAPMEFVGLGVVGETGSPVWFELHTNAFDDAVGFYRDVFEWKTESMSDSDEFRYAVVDGGENGVAGVFDATSSLGDQLPQWVVYFGVDNVDNTVAEVTRLGGRLLSGAENTPYGVMATVADPSGATFRLLANSPQA